MGINIADGADIAVPQPLLNFLQAHAVGVKQAGAAVAQVVEADGIPFQTNDLAAPQPVECSHDNAELCRVALDRCEELFQFLCLVDLRLELFLTRTFNAVCGVGTDHADLKSVLQAFADVGVIVDDGVCRNAAIQLMLIEILNVLGVLLKVLQGVVERLKIRKRSLLRQP